jgi:hypothetical protein
MAASEEYSLAMLASRAKGSPACMSPAAWRQARRDRWARTSMSAIMNWIACRPAIGWPKDSRVSA